MNVMPFLHSTHIKCLETQNQVFKMAEFEFLWEINRPLQWGGVYVVRSWSWNNKIQVCSYAFFFKFYFSLAICFENWQCKKILTFLCLAGRALTLVFVDGESSQIYSLYYERSFFKIIFLFHKSAFWCCFSFCIDTLKILVLIAQSLKGVAG